MPANGARGAPASLGTSGSGQVRDAGLAGAAERRHELTQQRRWRPQHRASGAIEINEQQTGRRDHTSDGDGRAACPATQGCNQDSRLDAEESKEEWPAATGRASGKSSQVPCLLIANLIIFIAYSIALISNIDYELLAELSSQARPSLTVQNFPSRERHLDQADRRCHQHNGNVESSSLDSMMMMLDGRAQVPPERHGADDDCPVGAAGSLGECGPHPAATRWSRAGERAGQLMSRPVSELGARERAQRSGRGRDWAWMATTHMSHYLLIIATLMDFLCAVHWHGTNKFYTLMLPRRVSAEARVSSSGRWALLAASWLRAGASLLASPKHLFQLLQVAAVSLAASSTASLAAQPKYGDSDDLHSPWSLRGLTFLMSSINLLNQTLAYALRAHEVSQSSEDYCTPPSSSSLLSANAPSQRAPRPTNKNSKAPLGKFKYYLMVSRMCHLKLTLMTLFLHLDSTQKPFEFTPVSLALTACVTQAFFAMYERYDEYHTRYTFNTTTNGRASLEMELKNELSAV